MPEYIYIKRERAPVVSASNLYAVRSGSDAGAHINANRKPQYSQAHTHTRQALMIAFDAFPNAFARSVSGEHSVSQAKRLVVQ